MTSRPLLTRVARVDGDHRAHRPGGVGQRVLGGDVRPAPRGVRPRNGPPEAVTTSLRTSARVAAGQRLEERGVLGVDRDDLAGLGERLDQRAADDQRLLVGQGQGPARLEGGQGRGEADGAGDAVEHGVAGGGGELGGRVGPGQDLGQRLARAVLRSASASRSAGTASSRATATVSTRSWWACSASSPTRPPAAESAVTRKRSGLRRTRSMAWVPMDPVEPRTTMSGAARAVEVGGGRLEARMRVGEGVRHVVHCGRSPRGRGRPRACPTDHRAAGAPRTARAGAGPALPDRPRAVRRGPLSGWAGGRCPSGSGPGWRRRSRGRRRWGR